MIQINEPGGYDKLQYKELDDEASTKGANFAFKHIKIPEEQTVIVETEAFGVNYADVCIRWGLYESAKQYVGWPITPGFEFSGKVIKIGQDVKKFKVGDLVSGVTLFGAYSKRVQVPENQLVHLPTEKMSMSEAGGFFCVALTAWYAMFELCKLRKGDKILIHSAAGGVGSMLVQMGKIAGCHVTGVVGRAHKVEIVKNLGCDAVIDKSSEDLWIAARKHSGGSGFHAVFDANGVETLKQSYDNLAPGGRLITYGAHTMLPKSTADGSGYLSIWNWAKIAWNLSKSPTFDPMKMTSENKSVLAFNLSFLFERMDLFKEATDQLLQWVNEGKLSVAKVTEYSMKEVASAHRDLESGQTTGKLVIITKDSFQVAE